MPTVPTVSGRQVLSTGVQAPAQQAFTQPGIGDAIAQTIPQYASVYADARNKANVAQMQDASLQLHSVSNDLLTNPQTGLLTLQGKNAIGKGAEYTQKFDAKAQELAQTLPEGSREAFMQQAQQQRIQFSTQASRHEIGQINQYEESQFHSILLTNAQAASSQYNDNAAYISTNKQTFQQIEDYGAAHGWSPEQIQAKKIEFKEKSAKATAENAVGANYMQVRQQNAELSDIANGAIRVPFSGEDSSRGLRNNNPGNIEASNQNPWVGQVGSDGRFAKFETPEHGIRALGKNLLSYQNQGVDTIKEIINRWAPASDNNDTAAYISAVCKQLGVKPDQQIDASNPNTLKELCAAIINHENGGQPYSSEQISTGVNAALGISSLPTSTKRYTGTAWFDALNESDQASVLRQTDALVKQQQSEYRSMLDGRVRDATAAYMRGVEFPSPPSQTDFLNAYGFREGNLRYTEFRNTQIAGQYIGAFRTLPTASIESAVANLKPDVNQTGEGYASRVNTFDAVSRAASEVIHQRQSDPVQYSLATGQSQPIDMSNQNAFGKSISLRASQIGDMSRAYGTPLTFFSKEEKDQIGQFMKNAPVSQQTIFLDTIKKSTGGGRVYMTALQQISENAPSAAVAGILMDKPGGVIAQANWFNPDITVSPITAANTILEGSAARRGAKDIKGMQLPKENDMRLQFSDMVKDAFAGDAQGASMAYEIAKDYYAGVMAKKGNVSSELDNDVWKQAINVATGGVHDYNGMGHVLLPWGMSADQFDKQVNQAWQTQVTGAGVKAPPGQYGLQSHGDSQYLVKLGSGYLLKSDGTPVILDLTQQRQRFIGDIPQ